MDFNSSFIRTPMFVDLYFDSILVIPGMCLGVPLLLWAVWSLCRRQGDVGGVLVFIIFLIAGDVLEIVLSLSLMISKYLELVSTQAAVSCIVSVRFSGLCFHQLLALEGIRSASHPLLPCHLSSLLVSIPLSITLWMSAFTLDFPKWATALYLFNGVFVGIVVVISYVLACKPPSSTEASFHRGRKPALRMLAVAQVTLLFVHGPFTFNLFYPLIYFSELRYYQLWQLIVFVMGLRWMVDPLLCVLVHKERVRWQSSDTTRIPH